MGFNIFEAANTINTLMNYGKEKNTEKKESKGPTVEMVRRPNFVERGIGNIKSSIDRRIEKKKEEKNRKLEAEILGAKRLFFDKIKNYTQDIDFKGLELDRVFDELEKRMLNNGFSKPEDYENYPMDNALEMVREIVNDMASTDHFDKKVSDFIDTIDIDLYDDCVWSFLYDIMSPDFGKNYAESGLSDDVIEIYLERTRKVLPSMKKWEDKKRVSPESKGKYLSTEDIVMHGYDEYRLELAKKIVDTNFKKFDSGNFLKDKYLFNQATNLVKDRVSAKEGWVDETFEFPEEEVEKFFEICKIYTSLKKENKEFDEDDLFNEAEQKYDEENSDEAKLKKVRQDLGIKK